MSIIGYVRADGTLCHIGDFFEGFEAGQAWGWLQRAAERGDPELRSHFAAALLPQLLHIGREQGYPSILVTPYPDDPARLEVTFRREPPAPEPGEPVHFWAAVGPRVSTAQLDDLRASAAFTLIRVIPARADDVYFVEVADPDAPATVAGLHLVPAYETDDAGRIRIRDYRTAVSAAAAAGS